MTSPEVEYDPQVDAAYIRFSRNPIVRTAEITYQLLLDYDKDGRIVGMEVLDASTQLPGDLLHSP